MSTPSWKKRAESYTRHSQPNGRPVHPACTFRPNRKFGEGQPCSCDKLWGRWDGTDESLVQLVQEGQRAAARRKGSQHGDDLQKYLENDARKGWDGFWSNAEHLRCVSGREFLNGELDMKRFKSANWQRAREANK